MRAVRPIERVRVWSRNADHASRFADHEGGGGVPVEPVASVEEAVSGADVICTTTASTEPILMGSWLSPGVHINAVGASVPGFRELDSEAVQLARLYTDRRESLFNESDDFRIPLKEGRINEAHLKGEIGEVLTGKVQGRTDASEITIFKSLGIAVEDLASAHHVYTRALEKKMGTWVEFSGERELGPQ
jgi:ornithine cyclodeaminase/alanine dehydrogenase-like protein (mu-crystallin family)